MSQGVGVVVAVYGGADPEQLDACLRSLSDQTLQPSEVWVVMDGPVSLRHEEVVASFEGLLPLRLERSTTRLGAGPARQLAVARADSEFLAVADADDISVPVRLATQKEMMVEQGLDLTGSAMIEFGTAVRGPNVRGAPLSEAAIVRRLRMNNPFNHPTVMMRTAVARDVGGYRDLPFLEDYDLIARMIAAGARSANSPEPLVHFRMDEQTLRRRSSLRAFVSEVSMQKLLVGLGFVSRRRAALNVIIRNGYRLAPRRVRGVVSQRVLSRSGKGDKA